MRVRRLARLVLALSLLAPTLLMTAGDWPSYLHDTSLTAASNDETVLFPNNVSQLTKLWSYKTGGIVAASPTIVGNTVYVGSWDGYEYAFDATTGAVQWKTYTGITSSTAPHCAPASGFGITSSAAVVSNTVYVGGGDSYWYALDATTGAVQWKIYTGDNSSTGGHYNWASPLIYGDDAYIGIASLCDKPLVQGQLTKVDLSTHQIDQFADFVPDGQVGGGVWTTPSLDTATNTIFVSTGTEGQEPPTSQPLSLAIVSLDATTLQVKGSWQVPSSQQVSDSDFGVSPILFNDQNGTPLVAAINKGGYLYAFNRNNISQGPVWERYVAVGGASPTNGDGSVSSGAFGGGRLYMAGGNTTINGQPAQGSVRAFDPATGTILWEHAAPGVIISPLAYANGFVIDGGGNYLEVLDAATGARLYGYKTGGQIYNLSIANGHIYVGSSDGTLTALGLPNPLPTSTPTAPADANCPAGWSCQDVGNALPAGSETTSGATYSVTAGGTDIAGTWDAFRFLSQPINGDAQVSAQIVSQANTNANAKAGLMLRQGTGANAPYYGAFLTPGNGLVVQYRSTFGGGTTTLVNSAGAVSAPLYLQLRRQADSFATAISNDGVNYTLVPGSQQTVILPSSLLAGLAASSHNTTTAGTDVFANATVAALGAAPATPTPPADSNCPGAWTCQDIGSFAPPGSESFDGTTWSVKAAGQDIANAADQFHYVWKLLSGNGNVSAQVITQTNTNSSAKAGVMMRASTDPSAPFYAAFLRPDGNIDVRYRTAQGYYTRAAPTLPGPAPLYLRINRSGASGSTFATDSSPDGVHWTHVTGTTLNNMAMPTVALAGLAVTSRATGVLSTAQFQGVNISGTVVAPTPTPTATGTPATPTPTPPTTATAIPATPTATPSGPVSGTHFGLIGAAGGSDSYAFTPATSGPATIGVCAVASTTNVYTLAVYDHNGTLVGSGTSSSYCNWVDTSLTGGQSYTATVSAVTGSGGYRLAWDVNGAAVTWSVSGSIASQGGNAVFSFPTLSSGGVSLAACGPGGSTFDLALLSVRNATLAQAASASPCESVSYSGGARGLYRLKEVATSGSGAWSGTVTTELAPATPMPTSTTPPSASTATPTSTPTSTATPSGPVSGTHSGSISAVGGSDSYTFMPAQSGPLTVGSCSVSTGTNFDVYVYDNSHTLMASSASSSYCDWASASVTAGQKYTITTVATTGTGVYRLAWSVNGAPVVWKVSGSITTPGALSSVSFPILGAGPVLLSTCGPSGSNFDLSLADAQGHALASATTSSTCESLTYTATTRGLFRLQETGNGGTGAWTGTITTS